MFKKNIIYSKEQILIICILLAAVTLAVYWQVRHFDFVFDDVAYVTENNHLPLRYNRRKRPLGFQHKIFWSLEPLIWLSLMLDYQLYGLIRRLPHDQSHPPLFSRPCCSSAFFTG